MRDAGKRFDIIDNCRFAPQPCFGEMRAPFHGVRPPALDGINLGRGLAADVSTAAAVHRYFEGKIGTQDIIPEVSFLPCHLELLFNQFGVKFIGRPDEEYPFLRRYGIPGKNNPLNDKVGVYIDQDTVLKCARLHFVGIGENISGGRRIIRNGIPFSAGWETGAAPAPQTGFQHLLPDFLRRQLPDSQGQGFIAAAVPVFLHCSRPVAPAVLKKHLFGHLFHLFGMHSISSLANRSRISSTFSGVSFP